MIVFLLSACVILLLAVVVLQVTQMRRSVALDLTPVNQMFASVERAHERTERAVREEVAKNREENATGARQTRDELTASLRHVADGLNRQLSALTTTNEQKLDRMRETVEQRLLGLQEENAQKLDLFRQDTLAGAKATREEISTSLGTLGQHLGNRVAEFGLNQKVQFDMFAANLARLTDAIEQRLSAMQDDGRKRIDQVRQETAASVQKVREEVSAALTTFGNGIAKTMDLLGGNQRTQLGNVSEQIQRLTESNEKRLDGLRTAVDERLRLIQEDSGRRLDQMREEATRSGKAIGDGIGTSFKAFSEHVTGEVSKLTEGNERRMDGLRTAVEERLRTLTEDNAKSLEQMRATVDEKLQGTLEKRLGESFKLVSERLEQVYKGLGEMQTLASGVGDLKKVLTNVKTRGTWGEVLLGNLLEQVLTSDQYAANVATKDEQERVEYAIRLPGRGEDRDEVVWLPIDAKFPKEDYERLVEAQERADPDAADAAGRELERSVRNFAGMICDKYLNPPKTTDFGIMFLPTEGLYAEVVRRTGLMEVIQRQCRIVVAGPTTLAALLNSLQMGFRTLAIQKRSSEVWNVLGAVKTEFSKYGDVLAKVQKKLQEASNTVDTAAVRTRAIERKLRGVQELPSAEAERVLLLPVGADGEVSAETVDGVL